MPYNITHVPYAGTGYFTRTVTDYLSGSEQLKPFYAYAPDSSGIEKAIKDRANFPVNRQLLFDTLTQQYSQLKKHEKVTQNIELLKAENTFTVCTAHQPNLLTGYLYFIYKILHAIKLAEQLKEKYPDKNFVPVYYMGSEDNDLDELGTFRYNGNKYIWDGDGQTGAVGRMNTTALKTLLNNVFKLFGPPGNKLDELKEILANAYLSHPTIGSATQYLVNELFGRYGLIVLDPDDAGLKKEYINVMQDDLLHETPYSVVSAQIEKMPVKAQAHPRPINLFYLKDDIRERIEKHGEEWTVVNTEIKWTKEQLLEELNTHPERFSPNVILRGMFQETILPDVAFIGGGAEVAYWLQLKTVFNHYNVFYPVVLLRQSVMWVKPHEAKLIKQLQLSVNDVFAEEHLLVRNYVAANSQADLQVTSEAAAMEQIMAQLKQKATTIDVTLKASAEAALTKIKYQLQVLEKKMLRAEKKKMQVQLQKIARMKTALFPNGGLQERVENFTDYYLHYGHSFFDVLKDAMQPDKQQFLIIEDVA